MRRFNTFSIAGNGKANDDYILCRQLSCSCLLAILADGIGGLAFGAQAAMLVSHSIADFIDLNFYVYPPEELLREAFYMADKTIRNKSYERCCKMGAAVCVTLICNDNMYFAWQGNVRLYKQNIDGVRMLTNDHIVCDGTSIYLSRCINGKGFRESVPVGKVSLSSKDIIYLCSDGYYQKIDIIGEKPQGNMDDDASIIEIINA